VVRRNLSLWGGVGAFAVLVAVLAVVAISRIPETSLDGRWHLMMIATPEGTFEPGTGSEWIEFDGPRFKGEMDCFEFDGEFLVTRSGRLELGGWGWGGGCEELDPASRAFDEHFGSVGEYRIGPNGLVLESADASVQFSYRPGDS
jgi:hypothetical protein